MFKKILKLALIYLTILLLLLISLNIVNLIPKKCIDSNVRKSYITLKQEGAFPKQKFTYNYLLDNYTDALMINTAYSVDPRKPLKSAILMRRNYRPNEDLSLEKIDNENNTIENLERTLEGSNTTYYEYSRYWHGYMIYLRPLLALFDYTQIRVILQSIIIILSVILMYLSYKKINIYALIATIFTLVISNFCFIGMSIQYSSAFIIMILASIYIILEHKHIKDITQVFFIIGILTSFFDLLTTPLITLGIPLIYWIVLKNIEDKVDLKTVFRIIAYWGIGYGVMWISKWIISDCLYQTGTITRALEKVTLLSNSKEEVAPNFIETIAKNIKYIINKEILYSIIILSIILSFMNKKDIKRKTPYIIIAIIPFIWFILIKNHSYVHARFTCRNLLLTIFSLSILILENIKEYLNVSKINKSN